jgi:hypothetical protein
MTSWKKPLLYSYSLPNHTVSIHGAHSIGDMYVKPGTSGSWGNM